MDDTTFQKIATFQYSSEAIIFKGKLESEGIEVFMRDNNTVDSNPIYSNAVGGVKLFVMNKDFLKANHILSEVSQYSLGDNNELIQCPNCGKKQVDMVTSITDIKSLFSFIFSMVFVLLPFHAKHKYKCESCHFEFDTNN
jgi:DNA-directed RNA polymerase subunit RPC12/RpoP